MIKNKKYIFFFGLIIAFLLFAFINLALSWSEKYTYGKLISNFFWNLPGWILMGAIDYAVLFVLNKKVRWKKDAVRITADLILSNLLILMISISVNYFISSVEINDYIAKFTIPILIWNSVIVLLMELFLYHQKQAEAERKLAIAEKEKIHYQYETLKAQINPHFLFNSLNVLSSLTYQDPEKANLFAKKMSGIYRYLLLTNAHLSVTLNEELSFLKSYIFLEQIRFEDALFVDIINEKEHQNKKVIPVCTQLLVENALKHNITTVQKPLFIRIDITNDGLIISNNLQLRSSVDKGGVGLENLRKQYALFHQAIDIEQTDTEFIVKLPFLD